MLRRLLLTSLVLVTIEAFNLDVGNSIAASSTFKNSYFGYAIAIHRYFGQKWLLVGAPREGGTGGVHKCRISGERFICSPLVPISNDLPLGSWSGATVSSSRGKALVGNTFSFCI